MDETSANVVGDGGRACGAFSAALQGLYQVPKSNWEVVHAKELLREQGSSSTPCLYYGDANTDVLFMGQQDTKAKSK